ncbi:Necrosis inducing protein NPP1 [Phytophthora megakarya]|uniref:Necrosis inducing protein NPP1 n=1 Tax=Phytophthora megakarya TaxID=4795 RepID=A0A225WM24_9STRA|nr:Necrosis inducing protein NPP1 [Phytophthora megakarya]
MNLRTFIFGAIASLVVVHADVAEVDHDEVKPFAQVEPTTDSEKSAIKYKPQLRISYGCHPYPAVQEDGAVSSGLKWSGWSNGDCKGSELGSQVYSRSDWYKGKWAIMYAWYFPKGRQYISKYRYGHRHFWSYGIVWTDNPNPDNSTIQGVSMSAGVGYDKATPPKSKYVIDNTTVKFESYKSFWGSKQGVQLTKKEGETQDLITWEQLTDEARTGLTDTDFGVDWSFRKVVVPMLDDVFEEKLEKNYPF